MEQQSPLELFHKKPQLPQKLRIGYASWGECDEKIFEAVENGLNIIIWFSIDLSCSKDGNKPEFSRGPNYSEVAKMVKKFHDHNYTVINLISVGGWNSAHVCTKFSAEEFIQEWKNFNAKISSPENFFWGFDGIDWDIEGNDDFSSSRNHFTFEELNLMGNFSLLLKKNGYYVAMAPAESYLDPYIQEEFDLSLLHNHPEWEKIVPNFNYHGRNCYSYLLSKYGTETFDFISIQIYEGYTHFIYKYEKEGKKFSEILEDLIRKITEGFWVDYSKEKESGLERKIVKIDKEKVVVGLANAWADGTEKFLFVDENEIKDGYNNLKNKGLDIRGFMFWDIADEGKVPKNSRDGKEFYMAKILKNLI